MTLAELQRDFRDWLTQASPEAAQRLDPRAGRGMTVYQNNYRAQLVGVLEASYPQLHAWLGSALFLEATIRHIDSRPPHSWTLDAYGADFETTLISMLPDNPDVHELAWIEWSLSESFVAPDAATLSSDQLANVDWDTACLQLAPSLRQRSVTTNAPDLWSALQQDTDAPESEMLATPGGVVTWRQGYSCQLKQIDTVEHDALLLLRDDSRFSALCDALVARLGEEAGIARAGELLASWISAGIVTDVG
jgi:hypothetical protein